MPFWLNCETTREKKMMEKQLEQKPQSTRLTQHSIWPVHQCIKAITPSFNFLGQTVYHKLFSKNVSLRMESLRMASVPNGKCLKGKCLRMATVRRASVSEWQVSEWQLSPNGNCRMASVPNGKCPKGKWRPAKWTCADDIYTLLMCLPTTLFSTSFLCFTFWQNKPLKRNH